MSVLTTLYYFFFAQDAQASAVFAVTSADGVATVVVATMPIAQPVLPVTSPGGGWWPAWWRVPRRRSTPTADLASWRRVFPQRRPHTLEVTGRLEIVASGSASVDYLNDVLTDEELLFLLEIV